MLDLGRMLKIADENNMLLVEGMDCAIIGIASRYGSEDVLAYSVNTIIDILMQRDKMTYEEADHFYKNQIEKSWVGPKTPVFINEIHLTI